MPQIRLEVGKKYINRVGVTILIIYKDKKECIFPFLGIDERDGQIFWFKTHGSETLSYIKSENDLIKQVAN